MGSSSLEHYQLRWNDFQSSVAGALRDLRQAEHLLDVVLAVDGRLLRAHRLVLAACSPLFAHMLASSSVASLSVASPAVIMLHGVPFDHVAAILSFMYCGEVNVAHEDLAPFLAVAEELQVKGLSQKSNNSSDGNSNSYAEQNDGQENDEEHKEKKSTKPSLLKTKRKAGSGSYESESKKSLVMVTPDMPVKNDDDSDDNDDDEESAGFNADVDRGRGSGSFGGGLDYSLMEEHARADADFQDGVYSGHLWSSSSLDPSGAEERAACPFCQRELKNSHSLSVHISRYHSDNGSSNVEVTCPVCQRKYGNKYSLRTHMHLNHKDQLHLLPSAKRGRKSGGGAANNNPGASTAGSSANPEPEQH